LKKDELNKLALQHLLQIERRKFNHIQSISIVGYTNAGKTSLFNYLTKRNKVVENALFVTLDSVTGKFYLPALKKEITISDTIGFIKDLPPSLIESFKSTLLESINADIILHVIDIKDPEMDQKINIVNTILRELKVHSKKIIYVFNKIDAFKGDAEMLLKKINEIYAANTPQYISVTTDYGINKLLTEIEKQLI
ncbi:MAG: GTPase, partial [Patescibacteria group bacterium]